MTDNPTKRPNDPKATGRWENEGGAPRAGDIAEQRARAKLTHYLRFGGAPGGFRPMSAKTVRDGETPSGLMVRL
jgi:hypothetical protein